ncbi:MAG TPA: PEP-CTERM sorting domain-containing protein [Edaphobacter sp.]|jgi:hypothetical protein|nr:PEP-CTERM sorting domain-containing protein [Edaphobacter sp.]
MKRCAQWLGSAVVAVVFMLSCLSRPVLADSYSIVDLGNANGHGIYGIDTAGDVVVWGTSGCGPAASFCYVTYSDGVASNDGSVAPTLAYDNGTSCGSAPAGFNASKTSCNGEWTGLGSFFNPNGDSNGVYFGSGTDLDFIHSGSADQVFLNSAGDFAWTDGQGEEMYELIQTAGPVLTDFDASIQPDFDPVTTPEPRSLLLVGSGLIFATIMLRRSRANRYRSLAE